MFRTDTREGKLLAAKLFLKLTANRKSHFEKHHLMLNLTKTEFSVLCMIVLFDMNNYAIGEKLHISPDTVGDHIKKINRKLLVFGEGKRKRMNLIDEYKSVILNHIAVTNPENFSTARDWVRIPLVMKDFETINDFVLRIVYNHVYGKDLLEDLIFPWELDEIYTEKQTEKHTVEITVDTMEEFEEIKKYLIIDDEEDESS